MMKFGIALLLLAVATPSFAADDPAVTICETVLKARLKAPKSYERVDAAISRNLVRITYDAVNVYNAPLRDVKVCAFAAMKDGRFTLTAYEFEAFETEMAAINKEIDAAKSGQVSKQKLDELQRRVDAALAKSRAAAADIIMDVIVAEGTGMFPIMPQTTQLRTRDGN